MVDAGAGGGRSSPLQGRSCKKFYSRTPSHASLTSLVKFHNSVTLYETPLRTTDRRGRGSYMQMYSISNSRKRFPAIPFELVHVFIIQRSTFVFSGARASFRLQSGPAYTALTPSAAPPAADRPNNVKPYVVEFAPLGEAVT